MLACLSLTLTTFCGAPPVDELNQYLYPSKTALVAVMDLRVARASGLFDEQFEQGFDRMLQRNEQLQQLSTMLEFDPAKQLEKVTICGGPQRDDQSFLVIINGRFPYERFKEALAEMTEEGELSVLEINELKVYFNHRERNAMYFAVVDANTLIATPSKKWMEDAVDGLTELRTLEEAMASRLDWKTEEPDQAIQLAGLFPERARQQIARNPQLSAIAEKLVGFNVAVQLGERPHVRLRLSMTDREAADQATVMFQTMIAFGRAAMSNHRRQDIAQVLNDLKVEPDEEHVHFDVSMTRELFEQIMDNNREDRERAIERRRQRQQEREQAGSES